MRREGARARNLDVVDDGSEDVRAGFGEAARAVLDRLEVRTVRAAHDDDRIDHHRQRHDVADDAVRRRVDDDVVVVGARPLEEIADHGRPENRRGGNALGQGGGDDVKTRQGRMVHERGKVRNLVPGAL